MVKRSRRKIKGKKKGKSIWKRMSDSARARDKRKRQSRSVKPEKKGPGLVTRLGYHLKKKHIEKKHASGWTEHTYYH